MSLSPSAPPEGGAVFKDITEPRRVVVTGLGAITAQGTSADALWEHVRDGRVAIRPVDHLPMEGYMTQLGGEVKEEAPPEHDYAHPDGYREPVLDYGLKAAEEAVQQCGILPGGQIPPERWGIAVGTCNAGLLAAEEWYRGKMNGESPDPQVLLLSTPQALAETLAAAFDVKGPVVSVNTACAASANAIGYGAEMIRYGQADAVLAGGAEALSGVLYSGFNCLQSLSPKPAAPYSRDRDGLSLGEGSGMMVLMREDLARELGAPVIAELLGYSLSADGYHPTAPHPEGEGAGRAIKSALASAGASPGEVAYVNSHGTGTPKNDPAETAATKVGLGEHARETAVSSTKSMIGHLLGAAGAVENIVTVRAIQEQVAPPTANYTEPDPECDLDYVPNEQRALPIDVAVSNNFAFGGANASVVWARPGMRDSAPPLPDFDRIVITGMATLTPAGLDPEALWAAFSEGRVPSEPENGNWVGRVVFDPAEYLPPKERKRVDRLGLFSLIGSKLALEDAGLELTEDNRARVGAVIGTGVGPMESMEAFSRPVFEEGAAAANPAVFPNTVYNAAGGQVAMKIGAVGPASTVTAGHAAGTQALTYAFDLAASGKADAMLCIAADTLTDTVVEAYRELGSLTGSEPGSNGSGGFALAEAAVVFVVERLARAKERGARIYGEILGYGITSDAVAVGRIDKEGRGIERAMQIALEGAGVEPDAITAVWASASGFKLADEAEAAAIQRVFGDGANVQRPKVKLGEPMGVGGALNAALALKSWEQDDAGPVLVNSLSLGGTNFSVVLAPFASD
jgi:3-oxoacyl-[acyl-carrier-protein] synthase II